MLTLSVNGETLLTPAQTLAAVLQELKMPAQGIAVAVNGIVVRRADHANHSLQSGDKVEIIRAVQGG